MITQYFPDILKTVVAAVAVKLGTDVFFDHGHYAEVVKNLAYKDMAASVKDKKYPLVWLVMDYDEDIYPNPSVYSSIPALQIIIAAPTNNTWTQDERDVNFKTNLYPVYAALIDQLAKTKEFGMPNRKMLAHKKTDRPYWGGSQDPNGNNTANLFNDYIDAIQIRNLNLKIQEKFC